MAGIESRRGESYIYVVNDARAQVGSEDRWRIVAKYEDESDDPIRTCAYHNAGLDGLGGSSYINAGKE